MWHFCDHTHPFLTVFLCCIKRTSLPVHRPWMSSFTNSTLSACCFVVSPTTPFSRSRTPFCHHHQAFLFVRFSHNLRGVSCSRCNISVPNHRISIRTEGYLSNYRLHCTSSAARMSFKSRPIAVSPCTHLLRREAFCQVYRNVFSCLLFRVVRASFPSVSFPSSLKVTDSR